jgi:hypothetical protein
VRQNPDRFGTGIMAMSNVETNDTNNHLEYFSPARCEKCQYQFHKPYYSNIDYGEVVFQSELTENYAFWYFLYDPTWEEINRLCEEMDSGLSKQDRRIIMARCADPIHGKRLTILHCPRCGSTETTFQHDETSWRKGFLKKSIPLISFEGYKLLDAAARKDKILILYREIMGN